MERGKLDPAKRLLRIRGMGSALTAFGGWILIYVAFGLVDRTMFKSDNLINLLRAMSKYLLVGIGQSYVLITGCIDLSLGSVVGMSAMVSATLMSRGMHPAPALLITLASCLLVGAGNGILVGKLRLPSFIATMGSMFVARGVAYMVGGNRNTGAIAFGIGRAAADRFQNIFYYGKTLGIYNIVWISMLIFGAAFFILAKTRTGRHIYAVGSNADAARLSGISVSGAIGKAYTVSALCAFFTGLMLCGQSGMGNMEAGSDYEMYAAAIAVIGGVSPLGGTGLLLGTLAGAGVWQTLENGLNIVGAPIGIQRFAIGIIVVFSVLLDVLIRMNPVKKAKTGNDRP